MDFACRTKLLRMSFVATVLALAACTQGFAPSRPSATAPSYERIIGQLESADTLSIRERGAFSDFVPGDVIRVRYRVAANDRGPERRVGEGDVLRVKVYDRPDLSLRRVAVQTDGQLSLPLLGRVQAAGETLDELSTRVGFLYRLLDVRPQSISFSLVRAGSDALRANAETIEEIAVSNDLRIDLPSIDPIGVSRAPEAVWSDIRRAYRHRFGEEVDVAVGRVRTAARHVYVVGQVNRVGRVPLRPGMSPSMAVSAAGGLRAAADPDRLILMRLMPDKRFKYGTFGLSDDGATRRNGFATIRLLPNDVVVVREAGTEGVNMSIADAAAGALTMEVRRALRKFGPFITRREASARAPSCVSDVGIRNRSLGNALSIQLRAPILSQNYAWTMREHFENQKYLEAEQLAAASLLVREAIFGQSDLAVAQGLNTLGLTYDVQGRYVDAEALYARALLIQEKLLGPSHPFIASTIENLASVYVAECRYREARSLHQRVLAIRESVQGPGHPDLANSLASYAEFEEQVAAVEANALGRDSTRSRRR